MAGNAMDQLFQKTLTGVSSFFSPNFRKTWKYGVYMDQNMSSYGHKNNLLSYNTFTTDAAW